MESVGRRSRESAVQCPRLDSLFRYRGCSDKLLIVYDSPDEPRSDVKDTDFLDAWKPRFKALSVAGPLSGLWPLAVSGAGEWRSLVSRLRLPSALGNCLPLFGIVVNFTHIGHGLMAPDLWSRFQRPTTIQLWKRSGRRMAFTGLTPSQSRSCRFRPPGSCASTCAHPAHSPCRSPGSPFASAPVLQCGAGSRVGR